MSVNWRIVPLSEICDINPRLGKTVLPEEELFAFVPMAAVGAADGSIDVSTKRPYAEVKKGFTPFQSSDVLFAKITPCMENGKMAVVPKLESRYGFGSTEFHVIRPKDGIDPKYVYHYVSRSDFRKEAARHMTGAVGQKRVPTDFLKQSLIPLPPTLDDQRRIVAEIEKQFSRLDEAVTSLKRIQANLKRYKAAVLKAAVEGKLTEQWRKDHPDVESSDQLLKRILAERRAKWEDKELAKMKAKGIKPKDDSWKKKYNEPAGPDTSNLPELPEGLTWATIDQIVECLDSKRIPINKKERATRQGQIPYYGANGQVGWIDDYLFDEPLVLVVEDETFTGREIPFSYKITGKSWVNNHAHVLRNTSAVTIDFLNYALSFYPFTPLTTGTTGRKKLRRLR